MATDEERRAALQQTRVNAIWGVGRAYANKLINWGITNALDLSTMPESWAHKNLGGVVGLRLIKELNGEPSIVMEKELTEKKMIATTRMFGSTISQISELGSRCHLWPRCRNWTTEKRSQTISVFLVEEMDHR
jgi:DNA polymerase V